MTDTTAKIAAKGCQGTGITDELATRLYNDLGRRVVAIVELVSEARSERRDGKESVVLSIAGINPAMTHEQETHLRELARGLHFEQALVGRDQSVQASLLDGEDRATVTQTMERGAALLPHPYFASSLDNAACERCGRLELAPIHATESDLPDPDDEPTEPTVEEVRAAQDGADDLADEDPAEEHDHTIDGPDDVDEPLLDDATDEEDPEQYRTRHNPFAVVPPDDAA